MSIIGGSGSGKTNSLFNLISHQPYIDKIYLYAKDPYEAKYKLLINKRESAGLKHLNDSKACIMISMIFIKIVNFTIQIKNENNWLYLMIRLLTCLPMKNLSNSNWVFYQR